MSDRRPIWDWACDYVGDPASWAARGEMIFQFLRELGLQENHRVLDVGCGNLSAGGTLIAFLDQGQYVGIEPNGWLVEAALERYPVLLEKDPAFVWATDFSSAPYEGFDFVVAHSVLSHVAHWQMSQALRAIRGRVKESAVWLASLRLDQYNTYSEDWRYPGVSTFRLKTVMALGYQAGWLIEIMPDLRDRLVEVAPNDLHDWIKLTAIPTPEQANTMRLEEEAREREHTELMRRSSEELREALDREDAELERRSGVK